MNHHGGCWTTRPGVDSQHDVRVEHGDQRVEIATSGGQKEGVDHVSLASEIRVRSRYDGTFDTASCPTGKLPCRRGRPTNHRSNLLKRQLEHVMEHECQPLGGRQGIEYDQESKANRVG